MTRQTLFQHAMIPPLVILKLFAVILSDLSRLAVEAKDLHFLTACIVEVS